MINKLKTVNLTKSFKNLAEEGFITILHNINLTMESGKVTGLVGLNGSGKTTLFHILSGYQSATSGLVLLDSEKYNFAEDHRISDTLRRNISTVINGDLVNGELNMAEHVEMLLSIKMRTSNKEDMKRFVEYASMLSIDDRFFTQPSGTYSKGMKQKSSLLAAISTNTDFLMLDEPFVGLDTPSCTQLKNCIRTLTSTEKKAVLITSHTMEDLAELCDYVYSLKEGIISEAVDTAFFRDKCKHINLYFCGEQSVVVKTSGFFHEFANVLKNTLSMSEMDGDIIIYSENMNTICVSFLINYNWTVYEKTIKNVLSKSFVELLEKKLDLSFTGSAEFYNLKALAKILEKKMSIKV